MKVNLMGVEAPVKVYLRTVVDTNDADYATHEALLDKVPVQQIILVSNIAKISKEDFGGKWPKGEYQSEYRRKFLMVLEEHDISSDDLEMVEETFFDAYTDEGWHTLKSLDIIAKAERVIPFDNFTSNNLPK